MTNGKGNLSGRLFLFACSMLAALILTACSERNSGKFQGYIEGEFVYVASPFAGTLESLKVERGAQVKAGDQLFILENTSERAARNEAERRLAQARATLEDAMKSRRPSEIDSIEAQLRQAQAALALSEKDLARQEKLVKSRSGAMQDFDRAHSTNEQNRQKVAQIAAELRTAQLGSRSDQIAAASANVRALEAALSQAEWALAEKGQFSPQAGLVFDTLYREGEWVAAGRPVVVLLPPHNIKVRAFVPETLLGSIHSGERVHVFLDGLQDPIVGRVSFISPKAEYTPPVIYSRESRSKLVYMIEVTFDTKTAAGLHPGQPVDVQFGS